MSDSDLIQELLQKEAVQMSRDVEEIDSVVLRHADGEVAVLLYETRMPTDDSMGDFVQRRVAVRTSGESPVHHSLIAHSFFEREGS